MIHCCHCGIPLQRSSQYIGIADVILGLLNFILLMVHIREVYGGKPLWESTSSSDSYQSPSSYGSRHSSFGYRISNRTFPGLESFPIELVLTVAVCHAIQLIMGIVLYISATNKARNACLIWLVVTAFTALFTGLLFRLYEMLIVNEFTHELKQELEVSYFPGQQPIQVQLQHYHHHHPQSQTFDQQAVDNQSIHNTGQSHVTVFTVPQPPPPVTPAESGFTYNTSYSDNNGNPPPFSPYYPPITSMTPQQQYQHVPAALQPPPQYDVVVNGAYVGGPQVANSSTNYTVDSVIFPNDKNDYGKSFSKI